MDVKFQNQCTYSKEVLSELAKYSRKKSFTVYCIVFIILFTALGILFCFMLPVVSLIFFLGVLFLAVMLAIAPGRQAKTLHKRNEALYHCDIITQHFFYEDSFLFRNEQSGGEIKCQYPQIKKVKETPHLFLLTIDGGSITVLDKKGFVAGDGGDFSAFLSRKCSQAE